MQVQCHVSHVLWGYQFDVASNGSPNVINRGWNLEILLSSLFIDPTFPLPFLFSSPLISNYSTHSLNNAPYFASLLTFLHSLFFHILCLWMCGETKEQNKRMQVFGEAEASKAEPANSHRNLPSIMSSSYPITLKVTLPACNKQPYAYGFYKG